MTRLGIFGLMLASAITIGYEPAAEAAPVSSPEGATQLTASMGLVVKTVTRAGVAHRSTRRTARRVYRR